jgi:hypothetical protein
MSRGTKPPQPLSGYTATVRGLSQNRIIDHPGKTLKGEKMKPNATKTPLGYPACPTPTAQLSSQSISEPRT